MIELLLDTHSLIWLLFGDARLPERARLAVENTLQQGGRVGCSVITLVELTYLVEKGKLHPEVWHRTVQQVENQQSSLLAVPVDVAIIRRMTDVPREEVPDMPDRIIAATALHLGVPLVSRDRKIIASNLNTIWD